MSIRSEWCRNISNKDSHYSRRTKFRREGDVDIEILFSRITDEHESIVASQRGRRTEGRRELTGISGTP